MSISAALWLLWGIIGVVIETVALLNDIKGDTLSEHLRRWFRTDTHMGRTVWLISSAVVFCAWFIPHIALPHGSLF